MRRLLELRTERGRFATEIWSHENEPAPLEYGYAWITLAFFAFSLVGQWLFGWFAYTDEQIAHSRPITASDFVVQMLRETFENWQSEFLQLLWQVGGLAILLHVGSPQSKEGSDRLEEKVDALLRPIDPETGNQTIAMLDRKFARQPDEAPGAQVRWLIAALEQAAATSAQLDGGPSPAV